MSKYVSLDYLNDYSIQDLINAVENGLQRLNLKNQFKPNMKVLIKVCLPYSVGQDTAETTNPAVVRALVDVLSKLGVKCVVADSPEKKYGEASLSDAYLNSGMLEMANLTTCELNNDLKTTNIEILNGVKTKGITILDVATKVDAIINVGKLKMDENLGYLGASSNVFGLIPGEMKTLVLNRQITLEDFNHYIIDMHQALKDKIVLNVLDGIVSLEANKTQRMLNLLAMSECPYSLDAAVFDILNIKYDNTILKQAQNRELFDFNKPYKAVGEKIEKFKVEDFGLVEFDCFKEIKQPAGYFKSHQQRVMIDKNKCKGCKICSKICPTNAIMMKYDKNGELYAEVDYKKCIFCNKCITACPYNVVEQKTPLAYKSMMKEMEKYNK
ncbi:MAG: DUF362 domain-containing protein [Clostridia bacterium]|nr:DUF362 domain-containing protein [Clostridia bacterium]